MSPKLLLRECPIFESLVDEDLEKLAAMCSPVEWGAGATIFAEGNLARDLYVVEKGKVALQMQLPVTQPHLSKRITVDVVTKGEMVGWSAVVEPYKYTLTAVSLEPTRLMAIDGARLKALLKDDYRIGFEVMSRLIGVVASRLDETRHVLISERLASM